MAAITYTTGFSDTFLEVLQQGALADVVRELPEGAALVVPTPAHERDALVAWARMGGHGRPPLVVTLSMLLKELCQAVAPRTNVLSATDAEAAFDEAARRCNTSASILGVTLGTIHRWQRNGRQIDATNEAYTQRQRERLALVEQVIHTYFGILRPPEGIDAVDSDMHLQEALQVMATRVHEGNRIRLRLRDQQSDVEQLVVFGASPLPQLERLALQVLAATGWRIAIRWAEHCTVVIEGYGVDQDYVDCVAALTTGAGEWTHSDDATQPSGSIHIVRCSTKGSHDKAVLCISKEHCLLNDIRLADIAVVPVVADGIEWYLREHGWATGLPVADATSEPLMHVPIVTGLLAAFDVVVSQWRRDSVERLIRTGILDDVVPHVHRLLTVAQQLRILGGEGPSSWQEAIDAALAEPDVDTDTRYQCQLARAAFDALAMALQIDHGPCTPYEALGRFESQVLRPLRLEQTAQRWRRRDEVAGRISLAPEALRVARDTMRAALTMAHRLRAEAVPLGVHVATVRAAFARAIVSIPDARMGGVRFLRGDALAGRTWPVVISTGWTEDAVAVRSADDLDALVAPGEREARARRTLLAAACAAERHAYILWPATIDDEDQMEAVLLDELRALGAVDGAEHLIALQPTTQVLLGPADVRMRSARKVPPPPLVPYFSVTQLREAPAARLAAARSAPYSASRLDMAAACMYQFAMRRVVKLDQTSYDDVRQTPLERGTMLHAIFHDFIISLMDEKGALEQPGISLCDWEYDVLWQRLRAIAERKVGDPKWMYAQVDARTLFGTPTDAGILQQWLVTARQLACNKGTRVLGTEIEINDTVDIDGTPVAVKGFIDRVDITRDGALLVYDYKNSKSSIPSKKGIEHGEKTQMVLYARAARNWAVGKGYEPTHVLGVYENIGSKLRDTDRGPRPAYGPREVSKALNLSGTTADVQTSEQSVRLLLDRFGSDTLSVDPVSSAVCNRCGLQSVCRVNEL